MPTDRRVLKDRARAIGGALAVIIFASNSATAADFFSGKTIRVVVGYGPASAYALGRQDILLRCSVPCKRLRDSWVSSLMR